MSILILDIQIQLQQLFIGLSGKLTSFGASFCLAISYIPNLAVEYVSCRSSEADIPLYSPKIPVKTKQANYPSYHNHSMTFQVKSNVLLRLI